jgi:protease I
MKRVLFIIAQNNFQDHELKAPKKVLGDAGISTYVASETTKVAKGTFGSQIIPDYSFSEAFRRVDEFSAVVVVGGTGCAGLMNNSYVMRILKRANEVGEVLAAICWGPRILARAGVLRGRHATVNTEPGSEVAKELEAAGAVLTGANVVVDGRIITAFGPTFATEFGKAILAKLK